jgi:hypothetical protein
MPDRLGRSGHHAGGGPSLTPTCLSRPPLVEPAGRLWGDQAGVVRLEHERPDRADRCSWSADLVDGAEVGLDPVGGDPGPHVAPAVGEESQVRVHSGVRDQCRTGPVAAGGYGRADQLGADGGRVRVGVVGLEVVGPGLVHVTGQHHRVTDVPVDPTPLQPVAGGPVALPVVHVARPGRVPLAGEEHLLAQQVPHAEVPGQAVQQPGRRR